MKYSGLYLKQKQSLSLSTKVLMSEKRIIEFHTRMDGNVYISWSGGKDSTVLMHLVKNIYPDTLVVFSDTGLEYPEIRTFVKKRLDTIWVKPEMNFRQVIEKYGYPVISKEQAQYIREYRTTKSEYLRDVRWNGKNGRFKISEKWKFLVDAPFKISEQCCNVLKKRPFKKFRMENHLAPILGTMAIDSSLRKQLYLRRGCNSFIEDKEVSTPLGFWTEDDIWGYIEINNLEYCDIYDKGVNRTGCIFCLFGMQREKSNRFQMLKKLHPKLYEYCMNDLGLKKVISFIEEGALK